MRTSERFSLFLPQGHFRLFVFIVLICGTCDIASAQSGRRSTPAPTAPTSIPAAADIKTPVPKPATQVASLIVSGEIAHDNVYFSSNYLDLAIKECVNSIKLSGVHDVTKGGKMKFNEAKERARAETDKYLLWISFVTRTDSLGGMYIDFTEYALLTPKTAVRLTSGRVRPGEDNVLSRGGILTIPTGRSTRASLLLSMKGAARDVAAVLVHGGWLAR
jgi:hypothetical protein